MLENSLLQLTNQKKKILFGLSTAERFIKCYSTFSDYFEFGDTAVLYSILGFINENIEEKALDKNHYNELLQLLDINTPDMDDFNSSVIATAALNVCVIINETLNLINDNSFKRLKDISTAATDTIDAFIFEIANLEYDSKHLENKILEHPLMQEEIQVQKNMISFLNLIDNIGLSDLDTLREMRINSRLSRLDLNAFI